MARLYDEVALNQFARNVVALFSWLVKPALMLIAGLLYGSVYAENMRATVYIGSLDFPPLAHVGTEGRISGRAVETVRRLCELANMQCRFRIFSAARAYSNFEQGALDVLITADYPRFLACCTLSQWKFRINTGIFSIQAHKNVPDSETSLLGQKIIMIRGWQSPYKVFPNLDSLVERKAVRVAYSNSIVSSIKMHKMGRAPLLWGSDTFAWYYDKLGIDAANYKFQLLSSIPAGLWVHKNGSLRKQTANQELLLRFNRAYQKLKAQNELTDDNFLVPSSMDKVYQDASFTP